MNRLQVLSLTTLMLMIAFRLPGQTPDHEWDAQIVVCNDGKIGVDVARAYRHPDYFSGDQWEVTGWFHVDPGKCEAIGKSESYATGGVLLKDPITLLAFGFRDSTGVSGSIRFSPGTKNYYPTNQQFCVETEGFLYRASGSNPPRDCTGAQFLIPASYEFTGPLNSSRVGVSNNELHVSIGPNDRAIPFGKQSSGSGVSQSTGGGGQSKGDANVGACGKVSCWDLLLQGLNQAAKDNEAQRGASNANNNPPPPTRPKPVVSAVRTPAALPQRPRLAPIMVGKIDVSHLAGLQRGDTPEYVSSIFGQPTSAPEQDSSGFGGYPHKRDDGSSIRVNYYDNVVTRVKAYSKGSRSVSEPLLDLLGKDESAAVALLGPPQTRESLLNIDNTDLVWSFPMPGRPAESRPEPEATQTLTLHFKTGVGCQSVALVW